MVFYCFFEVIIINFFFKEFIYRIYKYSKVFIELWFLIMVERVYWYVYYVGFGSKLYGDINNLINKINNI